jgi:hypothetical protein
MFLGSVYFQANEEAIPNVQSRSAVFVAALDTGVDPARAFGSVHCHVCEQLDLSDIYKEYESRDGRGWLRTIRS